MNKKITIALALIAMITGKSETAVASNNDNTASDSLPTVYFSREISPKALVEIFKAVGVEPTGKVAVKSAPAKGATPIISNRNSSASL